MIQLSSPTTLRNPMTCCHRLRGLGSAVILTPIALALFQVQPGRAHMRGMYDTKAEAEKRAAELKCKGAFAMGSMWMPCANERALHEALQKAQ